MSKSDFGYDKIENNLISAYIANRDLFVKCEHIVFPALFFESHTRWAYKKVKEFHQKQIKPDIILLAAEARKESLPKEFMAQFGELIGHPYEYSTQPEQYVTMLFSRYVANYLNPLLEDAALKLKDYSGDSLEVMYSIKEAITKVELVVNNVSKERGISDVVDEALKQIKEAKESKVPLGYSTGVSNVDEVIGSVSPGVIIIGARPSMGKTSFIVNMITKNAVLLDAPVLMFSLEMPSTQIVKNVFANMYEINSFAIKTGKVSDEEMMMMEGTSLRLKKNLIIDDTPAITWQYIEAKLRQVRKDIPFSKPIIVLIDYIQLMSNTPEETHGKTDEGILETRLNKINALWKPYNACIVGLSQLSRECEKRNPPRPIMSDLKGSGAIEANADVVMLMYRPDYYYENPTDEKTGVSLKGLVEFIIHKNRHGKRGNVYGRFLNRYSKFEDYNPDDNGIKSNDTDAF